MAITPTEEIIKQITELADDPLGKVFYCTWSTKHGEIRWQGGYVQVRRLGQQYFSFGEEPSAFLESVEQQRALDGVYSLPDGGTRRN